MMQLAQAIGWLPDARLFGDAQTLVYRVHTDSRSLQPGDLFVALRGDHFDAHAFLPQARVQGAVAVMVEHSVVTSGLPGIEVADVRRALGQLAGGWRSQFTLPMIAVTGSNGKTTVTQMVAGILRAWLQDAAFATEGNFNNDVGLPLTLLRLRAQHQIGVVELGMNHPGEIAYLAGLVRPTVALVNNAQREHLEFMHTVEAVARENAAVFASLAVDGTAVFPADDAFASLWHQQCTNRKVLTFALDSPADLSATAVWKTDHWQVAATTPVGQLEFKLRAAGRHNVRNALAAAACALAAGAPLACIGAGLAGFLPVRGRSLTVSLQLDDHAVTLVDDTYNANPDSMQAALELLAQLPGPRLLVMGDMGEVGDQGPQFHAEAGCNAHAMGIEKLFTLGEQSARASAAFGGGRHFGTIAEMVASVQAELPQVASILVKGSRFMQMERVVQALTAGSVSRAAGSLPAEMLPVEKKALHAA